MSSHAQYDDHPSRPPLMFQLAVELSSKQVLSYPPALLLHIYPPSCKLPKRITIIPSKHPVAGLPAALRPYLAFRVLAALIPAVPAR